MIINRTKIRAARIDLTRLLIVVLFVTYYIVAFTHTDKQVDNKIRKNKKQNNNIILGRLFLPPEVVCDQPLPDQCLPTLHLRWFSRSENKRRLMFNCNVSS